MTREFLSYMYIYCALKYQHWNFFDRMVKSIQTENKDIVFTEAVYIAHLPPLFQELREIFFSRMRDKKRHFLSLLKGSMSQGAYDDLFPTAASSTEITVNVSDIQIEYFRQ